MLFIAGQTAWAKGEKTRERLSDAVHSSMPGGGSDMISCLQLGYKELLLNYRRDYMNQVLFLTDAAGGSEEIFELAVAYREIGINVTTIGLGEDCDLDFLSDLAGWEGGGSRFISGREKMEEIFGSDFGRIVIPAARDVETAVIESVGQVIVPRDEEVNAML